MALDPMAMMRAARPAMNPDMRAAQQSIQAPDGTLRSMADLATTPASPGYRDKMPPPPCYRCSEDHQPNKRYDHPYMHEPHVISPDPQVHQMVDRIRDEGAVEYGHRIEVTQVASAPVPKRVAIYVGKNDTYVVAVEEAPDWDSVQSFKVVEDQLLAMVQMARALGVKVQDKTGGDLAALEVG